MNAYNGRGPIEKRGREGVGGVGVRFQNGQCNAVKISLRMLSLNYKVMVFSDIHCNNFPSISYSLSFVSHAPLIFFKADPVLPQERNTDWIWEWSSRVEVQPQK